MYKYRSHGYIVTHGLYCWPYRRARRCSRMLRILFHPLLTLPRHCLLLGAAAAIAAASAGSAAADGIALTKAPPLRVPSAYNWNGFYAGGHLGVAWAVRIGQRRQTATLVRFDLFQPIDTFSDEAGSFFEGVQAGYNYMLANRILLGAEVDATFPSFQNLSGISIGGTSNFTSPTLGPVSYSETVLSSGTVRSRIGYAPGRWLFYATGGFAWTYNQQTLTQLSTGNSEAPFLWRLGWAGRRRRRDADRAALDRAARISVHSGLWPPTHDGFGRFCLQLDPRHAHFALMDRARRLQTIDLAATRCFSAMPIVTKTPTAPDFVDNVNFHGQFTLVCSKATLRFRSPYQGTSSLPGGGQGRETNGFNTLCLVCGCGRAPKLPDFSPETSDARDTVLLGHARRGRIYKRRILQDRLPAIPTRACSAILPGRPSISVAKRGRWTPTSISSPVR